MKIRLKQFTDQPNAGDVASAIIVSELGNTQVNVVGEEPCGVPNLIAIGSILHWSDADSIIWGAGLIREALPVTPPRAIYAVRGLLTRDELHAQGVNCPEVIGDPAVLMAHLRPRQATPTTELGVIPHYVDVNSNFVTRARADGAKIINPLLPIEEYIAQLVDCRRIISSSLHGIIFAHSYGIPAVWVRLSNLVYGDGFKFRDYYSSIGFRPGWTPCFNGREPLGHIANNCHLPMTAIDSTALLEAFVLAMKTMQWRMSQL